jgi:hypothetical protein
MNLITRIAAQLHTTRAPQPTIAELTRVHSGTVPARVSDELAAASTGMNTVLVAPSLWAVYDAHITSSIAIGHIEAHNRSFHVALQGDELKPITFSTIEKAIEWFAQYHFALTLGARDSY